MTKNTLGKQNEQYCLRFHHVRNVECWGTLIKCANMIATQWKSHFQILSAPMLLFCESSKGCDATCIVTFAMEKKRKKILQHIKGVWENVMHLRQLLVQISTSSCRIIIYFFHLVRLFDTHACTGHGKTKGRVRTQVATCDSLLKPEPICCCYELETAKVQNKMCERKTHFFLQIKLQHILVRYVHVTLQQILTDLTASDRERCYEQTVWT